MLGDASILFASETLARLPKNAAVVGWLRPAKDQPLTGRAALTIAALTSRFVPSSAFEPECGLRSTRR